MKHLRLTLLSILAGIANGQGNNGQEELTRIIGGSEAIENRYPYAVLVLDPFLSSCGGSLIARDVVLTAAHCTTNMSHSVLGRHDVNDDDGMVFAASRVIPHPRYNPVTTDHDFMLMFLKVNSAADDIVTIKLNSNPMIPSVGQTLTVMGWGDTIIGTSESMRSDALMNVSDMMTIRNIGPTRV
jgi:trypsin